MSDAPATTTNPDDANFDPYQDVATSKLLDEPINGLDWIDKKYKNPDAFALIIGISRYQSIPSLQYAARDAKNLKTILSRRSVFLPKNITLLLDEQATAGNTRNALSNIITQTKDTPQSVVLVYFSGHGSFFGANAQPDDSLLLLYDTSSQNISPSVALSVNQLQQDLNALPSPNVVAILDACFGGGGRSFIGNNKVARIIDKTKGLFGNNASKTLVVAAQSKVAEEYEAGQQGAFSYHFMEALLGKAEPAADHWIYLQPAFNYAKLKLKGKNQDPGLSGSNTPIKLVLQP